MCDCVFCQYDGSHPASHPQANNCPKCGHTESEN